MKQALLILLIIFALVAAVLSQQIVTLSRHHQIHKQELAELNDIKHGLFNIDTWKEKIVFIVGAEISKLNLSRSKKNLKPVIESQLHALIDNVDRRLKEKNKKTFKGKFKQAFINTFVDIKEIKAGIPDYADTLIEVMERPKNQRKLKNALQNKVDEYFDKTFEGDELEVENQNTTKMTADALNKAKQSLQMQISTDQKTLELYSQILITIALIAFFLAWFSREVLSRAQFLLLVSILFFLVFTGVNTPMIDLEAKISEMSFMLFDHQVRFDNQILYFQTKSIVDVFWVMIRHRDFQMNVVGVLVITFSIIFPLLKLVGSIAYCFNSWNSRKNKWVQFFVLKAGKWSMTDVLIIAIFMAYIGFNGIVESQLYELHKATDEIVLLTTNGTTLQFGFYVFMAYAVLAMILTEFLVKRQDEKLFVAISKN